MIGIAISIISLILSLYTLWTTQIHRGRVAMTTPTVVFFGYDRVPKTTPKIFLRTLLYSTSARGQMIEGMYVKLRHGNSERVFSFWGYGESDKLVPGSGLHISRTGFAANHHFVMSVHESAFEFLPGEYGVVVYARVAGKKEARKIADVAIRLDADLASALIRHEGVLFERPIEGAYQGHTRV